MVWNARYPAWFVTLWLVVSSRFDDGTTTSAFVAIPTISSGFPTTFMTTTIPEVHRARRATMAAGKMSKETTTIDEDMTMTVSSVTKFHFPYVAPNGQNPWEKLVPQPLQLLLPGGMARALHVKGCDVVMEWTDQDSVHDVAKAMLRQCVQTSAKNDHEALQMAAYLANCLDTFQRFVRGHLHIPSSGKNNPRPLDRFRARLLATRGPTGTKCPRWHVDHVPVRWIQSLVGPGCDYVVDARTSDIWWVWQEHAEGEQDGERPPLEEIVCELPQLQASEQEVMLLVGNRWNEFARSLLHPVVHKSPDLALWQGRVLLTMDVVVPHASDDA